MDILLLFVVGIWLLLAYAVVRKRLDPVAAVVAAFLVFAVWYVLTGRV